MKFDFEDTEEVIDGKNRLLDHLDEDSVEEYYYQACIDSKSGSVLSALKDATCKLTILSENESREKEEIMTFPVLPLEFNIRLRRTGNILHLFKLVAMTVEDLGRDYRVAVSAEACTSEPEHAISEIRHQSLRTEIQVETDGEFETLVREFEGDIAVQGIDRGFSLHESSEIRGAVRRELESGKARP